MGRGSSSDVRSVWVGVSLPNQFDPGRNAGKNYLRLGGGIPPAFSFDLDEYARPGRDGAESDEQLPDKHTSLRGSFPA